MMSKRRKTADELEQETVQEPSSEQQDRPAETVAVTCYVPGGLALQLSEEFKNEAGGVEMRRVGPLVLIPTGDSQVDAAFWAAWVAQNGQNPLLLGRFILRLDHGHR